MARVLQSFFFALMDRGLFIDPPPHTHIQTHVFSPYWWWTVLVVRFYPLALFFVCFRFDFIQGCTVRKGHKIAWGIPVPYFYIFPLVCLFFVCVCVCFGVSSVLPFVPCFAKCGRHGRSPEGGYCPTVSSCRCCCHCRCSCFFCDLIFFPTLHGLRPQDRCG